MVLTPNTKAAYWMFTWNNYSECDLWQDLLKGFPDVTYLTWGLEIAPSTGTPHVQGYVEFSKRKALRTLKNLHSAHRTWGAFVNKISWHKATHGTWEECRDYCHKEAQGIYEEGEGRMNMRASRANQGKRTDIEEVRDRIKNGEIRSITSLEDNVCSMSALTFGLRLLKRYVPNNPKPPLVFWLHGSTGVGKSRYARELIRHLGERLEWHCWFNFDPKVKWFDNYWGQEIALFDDFRPNKCHYERLLQITDRYPSMQQNKGGTVWFAPRIIIFTCAVSIEKAFAHLSEDEPLAQFRRRIDGHGGSELNFNDSESISTFRSTILSFVVNEEPNEVQGDGGRPPDNRDVVPDEAPVDVPEQQPNGAGEEENPADPGVYGPVERDELHALPPSQEGIVGGARKRQRLVIELE